MRGQPLDLKNAKFNDIIGQEEVIHQIKSALLTGRNIILVGPPGIGKTTIAKNIASLLPEIEVEQDFPFKKEKKIKLKGEQRFVRVQGSPDLTSEDLLGDIDPIKAMKYGASSIEAFTPGKIFKANKGVLFFDEINRCPEKLQNALLQVLEEGSATLGSYSIDFPADFIFIATMNPEDYAATEQLSSVFLDRFDLIYVGYPESKELEKDIIEKSGQKLEVEFPNKLLDMCVSFVRKLRSHKDIEQKPSVRATLGLYERAQANTILAERKKVEFKDIQDALISVLKHRIKLKPSVRYLKDVSSFVKDEFENFLSSNPTYRQLSSSEEGEVG